MSYNGMYGTYPTSEFDNIYNLIIEIIDDYNTILPISTNLTGPTGPQGPEGPTGIQGPTGSLVPTIYSGYISNNLYTRNMTGASLQITNSAGGNVMQTYSYANTGTSNSTTITRFGTDDNITVLNTATITGLLYINSYLDYWNPYCAGAYRSTSQTGSSPSFVADLDTILFQSSAAASMVNLAANSFTIRVSGYYLVTLSGLVTTVASSTLLNWYVILSGSVSIPVTSFNSPIGFSANISFSKIVVLTAGQTINVTFLRTTALPTGSITVGGASLPDQFSMSIIYCGSS